MVRERLTYIDGLRGIAIAGVILTHAASITNLGGLPKNLLLLGSMGVQLFFVISAFTIFLSLSKTDGIKTQFRDFYIRRLFRIIPIYWIGVILYTIVYGLGSRGWLDGPELWHYPLHVFLVNCFHPDVTSSVVPGGWSISTEVMFYLLVPVLYRFFYTNKRLAIMMFFSLTALPLLNTRYGHYLLQSSFIGYEKVIIEQFVYRWIFGQLACFGFGMILFKIYQDGTYRKYISNPLVNLCFTAFVSVLLIMLRKFHLVLPEKHHLYAFMFMVLALLLSVHPWKIYVNKYTVFLGKISYSGYLLHFLVIKQISNLILYLRPDISTSSLAYFGIIAIGSFAITIPLAYLSYQFIELKAVDLGRQLMKRLNNKGAETQTA